ncbi:MAG: M23 family metallopeptidase [Myxococcota bacterium]|nr:M23 family metallopeptidase [Myxococcota bacterium]
MDLYTLILVGDERSPVKRFQVPKLAAHRAAALAGTLACLFALGVWDYWRVRAENTELPELREETLVQAAKIRGFERELAKVETELGRVQELERKVRIIANLPGAAASGGAEVTDIAPADAGVQLPTGVPIDRGQGGLGEPSFGLDELATPVAEDAMDFALMRDRAEILGGLAQVRAASLGVLVTDLERKSDQLASLPSVWPVRGWVTSRFGPRISPFTGRRHMHTGIDIATREGTVIVAPARARVLFTGSKGPLGRSVVLDHGFGVRTHYGHNSEILVKPGDLVERHQTIAKVGNTGRSTGPHLHYSVEVDKKSRDPLDYILD